MILFENRLVYRPTPFQGNPGHTPKDEIRDLFFHSSDGTRLHAWYFEVKTPKAHVLYLHGNAGNLRSRKRDLMYLRKRQQISILALDYRGYGKSEGSPHEKGLLEDARTARKILAKEAGIKEEDVILYGRSLGGGIAVHLASHDGARGLILQSTFTSLPDVSAHFYPWFPVRMLMRNRLDSLSIIDRYPGPLLQSHGTEDEVIPYGFGKRLHQKARSPKWWVDFPGTGHNEPTPKLFDTPIEKLLNYLATNGS